MMELKQNQSLVKGALFLALAGFISKILSAAYRIPLQNLTGDYGFYIYQQVYPFLGMMMILSLYGFPSAIAQIIADLSRGKKEISVRSVYGPILTLLLITTSIVSLALFFGADQMAKFIGDPQLGRAYRWVALALILVPFTALLRGAFQGLSRMDAIAYSQIGEQVIRVTIIIFAAIFISKGHTTVDHIGSFGVIASLGGATAAILILVSFSRRTQMIIPGKKTVSWRDYYRSLFVFGLLASLNHMILLLVQFADVFTLVPQLVKGGLAPLGAMELKGVFDRGMPLIQLGAVLGSSFALALVPTVAKGQLEKSKPAIESAFKISLFLSAGAAIGLMLIFEETNVLLYKNDLGTASLQVLSFSILFSSLSITAVSILQSLGSFRRTGIYILSTFILKVLLNVVLVPSMGIMGSALATVGSLFFLFILSYFALRRRIPGLRFLSVAWLRPFVLAAGSMALFLVLMKMLLPYGVFVSRGSLFFYVIMLVGLGTGLYMFFLLRFGLFTREEIDTFPFASLLERIYKGRD